MNLRLAAFLVILLACTGCDSVTAPSDNVTDTFSGTLEPLGQKIHDFNVNGNGEVAVKITSLQPNANVFLGVIVGKKNGNACEFSARIFPNEFAAVNIVAVTGPIEKGSWCVAIYDPLPGRLAATSTYTLTVSHP